MSRQTYLEVEGTRLPYRALSRLAVVAVLIIHTFQHFSLTILLSKGSTGWSLKEKKISEDKKTNIFLI